jgi:hypothetical protein
MALVEKDLFDRSLFVGRHMETAEYNPHAKPLRSAVNRLHEPLCRTDLNALRFELHVPEGFPGPTDSLREAHAAWNTLVDFAAEAFARADAGKPPPEVTHAAPDVARRAIGRLRTAIAALDTVEVDDPRADWIEPQLGVALRNIELATQRGNGCGHGLMAVYEVRKR